MKSMEYTPDLQQDLHDVSDEEKVDALCQHSERLFIFGLLNTKPEGLSLLPKIFEVFRFHNRSNCVG
jgi:hypothetical protein